MQLSSLFNVPLDGYCLVTAFTILSKGHGIPATRSDNNEVVLALDKGLAEQAMALMSFGHGQRATVEPLLVLASPGLSLVYPLSNSTYEALAEKRRASPIFTPDDLDNLHNGQFYIRFFGMM